MVVLREYACTKQNRSQKQYPPHNYTRPKNKTAKATVEVIRT